MLSRLDEEIVELMEDKDDLKQEIIGADSMREKIDLAIPTINSALESLKPERSHELRLTQSSMSISRQNLESEAAGGVHVSVHSERDNL